MKNFKKSIILLLIFCLVMCFSMTGCGSGDEPTDPAEDQTQEQGTDDQSEEQGEAEDTQEAETAEVTDAPEIAGLTFESELKRDYAEQFRVFRYEGGYKYFHIVDGDDFLLVPE